MLTKRQREMAELVMYGLSNKEIARKLNITEHTVRETLHKAFITLGFRKRSQLAVWMHAGIGLYDHDRYDR